MKYFKNKTSHLINRPDVSSRRCESQAWSSSRHFTGKPEQNITTKIHAKKDDGSASDIRRDILEFFLAQCTLVKSGSVHSG